MRNGNRIRAGGTQHWFYVEVAARAIEIIAWHFLFDLDTLPDIAVPARSEMVRGDASLIHSYSLLPRTVDETPIMMS